MSFIFKDDKMNTDIAMDKLLSLIFRYDDIIKLMNKNPILDSMNINFNTMWRRSIKKYFDKN